MITQIKEQLMKFLFIAGIQTARRLIRKDNRRVVY